VVVWAGDCAFESLIASPSLFACPRLERVRSRPLLAPKATKKRTHTIPTLLGAMADCAFSRQCSSSFASISVRAADTAYFMLSRTF
jgi:hypothetical protein